jgi:hypothetical protein
MRMLTTGECADLMNQWAESPHGYSAKFVLGQVDDGLLLARVNYRGANRQRARVRIHPEDFVQYVRTHHVALLAAACLHFGSLVVDDVPRETLGR